MKGTNQRYARKKTIISNKSLAQTHKSCIANIILTNYYTSHFAVVRHMDSYAFDTYVFTRVG